MNQSCCKRQRTLKSSRWFTTLTLLVSTIIPKQAESSNSHHRPELVVLNEAANSRGGQVYIQAMGDSEALRVLSSAMWFTTRMLHIDHTKKRKIALFITTLPEQQIASTENIDEISVIEISQQHLAQFPRNVTAELRGLIYEQMSNAWLNGVGVAPLGLTDGVAKLIRLRARLAPDDEFAPEQFNTRTQSPWELGSYATAHFIDYLEKTYDSGFLVKLNRKMARGWNESFTGEILGGRDIGELWRAWGVAPHPSPADFVQYSAAIARSWLPVSIRSLMMMVMTIMIAGNVCFGHVAWLLVP